MLVARSYTARVTLVFVPFAAVLLYAPNAAAQDTPRAAAPVTPAGWQWRTDAPARPQRGGPEGVSASTFEFHRWRQAGTSRWAPARSSIPAAGARWKAFVVRGDGHAAVLRHANGRTEELVPWVRHNAVVARGESGNARNVVRLRAEPDSVRFMVNDIVLQSWPRSAMSVDGRFGLRIGRDVNIHITNLDVMRRLAPFPSR